jgi:hypothetical protein
MIRSCTFIFTILMTGSLVAGPSVGFSKGEGGAIIHEYSGIEFPKKIQKYRRKSVEAFEESGYNVGVRYKKKDVHLTFFVYPREMGLEHAESEFLDALEYAESINPGTTNHNATCTTISKKEKSLEMFYGAFSYPKEQGATGDLLVIAGGEKSFYKIRATMPWTVDNIKETMLFIGDIMLELIPEKTLCNEEI